MAGGWEKAGARAVEVLERNRRLIEAGEFRAPRPPRITHAYKPRAKKRRRRSKRERPLTAAALPHAVERLQAHYDGVRPTR
jgi:hypothetical protein